ncbi:MAG: hypothetical protein H7067_07915 [Burkholderiales bacterium]|nr:hypothetical protein [Opitutaceae bacterium]
MIAVRDRARLVLPRPPGQGSFITDITSLVDRLFSGRLWHYQPIDLRYHDYQHTLQAAWTYLDLVEAGRAHLGPDLAPTVRDAELGFAAILLHDTGYLKARGDDEGTGAKYTYCHVLRSCALSASLLPAIACSQGEIEDVLGAIRCTGLSGIPANTTFRTAAARHVACMVATADYLGQMGAPEYPAKVPFLYAEFAEADEYSRIPTEKRNFTSLNQLLAATPAFWQKFVLPKLLNDFAGVYRYLSLPYPDGPNPYIQAVERNIAAISARSNPPFASVRG